MKRAMTISGRSMYGTVSIAVKIDTDGLTRDEVNNAMSDLSSRIMRVLPNALFVSIPLTSISVRDGS